MRRLLILSLLLTASARADLLVVANRGGSTVTLVDPQTMSFLGTIPAGLDPHEVAVDGRYAYVSNYGGGTGNTISVVDLETRTKVKDLPITPLLAPHGIVSVAGKIWFTAEHSRSVGRYDPATDRIDWIGRTNQVGTHMLAVRADGGAVYTGNIGHSTASIIPVAGPESSASATIPVVAGPEGVALSPDGKELWLGSREFQGISIIDVAQQKVVATIAGGTFAYRLTFSPDGKYVLVPRQGEVVVFDAAQRGVARTIAVNSTPFSIVMAPDHRTAYVATGGPNQILKIDYTTGAITARVALSALADGLAYATSDSEPARGKRRSVKKP
ncbi:MAG TPA: YncE family protein [Thermoanaerobaculia bacterium]|nr:YncE family protein [Thermoanaerobaculia bacterium]